MEVKSKIKNIREKYQNLKVLQKHAHGAIAILLSFLQKLCDLNSFMPQKYKQKILLKAIVETVEHC